MEVAFRVFVIEQAVDAAVELCALLFSCGEALGRGVSISPLVFADTDSAEEQYAIESPDLIIFGPKSSRDLEEGALKTLRTRVGLDPVPILLVLANSDIQSPGKLPAGCDDVLLLPYQRKLVAAKLASLRRFCGLGRALLAQRNQVRRNHADLLHELAGARQIFSNMSKEGCLGQLRAIRYHLSPQALLNGDVLAAAWAPGGRLFLMLGDITGHGLSAAVGAVPLTSIFYSMAPKGFSLGHLARELNNKLYSVLPANMFACAFLVELDMHRLQLRVFNAAMPSGCVLREQGALMLDSRHLPLGVLADVDFERCVQHVKLDAGDRLYFWSDGLLEARNPEGELFGEERLLASLESCPDPQRRFDQLLLEVSGYSLEQHDDLSLVEVDLDSIPIRPSPVGRQNIESSSRRGVDEVVADYLAPVAPMPLRDWTYSQTLTAEELRQREVLPELLVLLERLRGLDGIREVVSTVLGELLRNALEHGLLRLDTALRASEDGFAEYYRLLESGRAGLQSGWIRLDFFASAERAELDIVIEDSGQGFPAFFDPAGAYGGRGLSLLEGLCRRVRFAPGSSQVSVTLDLDQPSGPKPHSGSPRPVMTQ